jgi:hypothetical protein
MNFDIKLSGEELNTVLTGLGKLPAETSFDLINKIQSQAKTQIDEEDKKKKEAEEKELEQKVQEYIKKKKIK